MPRKPRFFVPGVSVHAIQRGNNRQAVFFKTEDYRVYLGWLKLAAEKYSCDIHAYVLMGISKNSLIGTGYLGRSQTAEMR
jgi:putative transposase